jgi:hypothetical protein
VAAEKLIKRYKPQEQLAKAFILSTGRQADTQELEIIEQFYQEEEERFTQNIGDAMAYLSTGSKPVDESLDPVKVASLATVINGIMNTTDGYTIR